MNGKQRKIKSGFLRIFFCGRMRSEIEVTLRRRKSCLDWISFLSNISPILCSPCHDIWLLSVSFDFSFLGSLRCPRLTFHIMKAKFLSQNMKHRTFWNVATEPAWHAQMIANNLPSSCWKFIFCFINCLESLISTGINFVCIRYIKMVVIFR